MKITEEQKQQLINLNDSKVNEILRVNKLEVGKWYKGHVDFKSLIYITKIGELSEHTPISYYGFFNGKFEHSDFANKDHEKSLTKATNEEVEKALINEAKKRGLVKGTKLTRSWTAKKEVCINDDEYELYDDKTLLLYGYEIFKDGKWAEVINKQDIINQINELLKQL